MVDTVTEATVGDKQVSIDTDGTAVVAWKMPLISRIYALFLGKIYVILKGKDPKTLNVQMTVV
ncbi:MAG: hypothetical protein KAJ73_09555, partial [Zetaproteobacteria bacterium]|nr:hypothetical protein [Zetaproteobacteria bacterium]